ncbi:integrase arm-type DNA-binding domain-containing protein [Ruegeria sp. HKCCD4884]|uniref:tyrosine-type recombinase/integrase n=1 Tax=Ruegeria sp. HKCCD4884 TaxID=2683022 RepID=UPI001492714E|nr:integrase arm-type DNA-binding domain-containing protein [Ruegeria sp. HKCCD4884]NOD92517.1 integrase arm-type DNA-binding domain-containing protein [Ruegeria sp. HKCCD4884]
MRLTDTAIKNAKPREKDYKLFDGYGLHVLVTRSGSKLWRMKYRYRGREKLLSFGPYPLVTLKHAREKRDEARLMLLEDLDPSEERKRARIEKDREREVTLGAVSQEYLNKLEKEGRAPATMKKLRWLVTLIEPQLADRPLRQIEAQDVLRLLRKVEANGTYETTRRLRSTIGSVFRFAIASGRASSDPTEPLKGALIRPTVKSRSAILDRVELGKLLNAIDGFSGQPTTMHALQLLSLMAPRPGELRQAQWSEFDLDDAVWRVPPERMKMRRPHRVPLAPQTLAGLRELQCHTGDGAFLFPSARNWQKPMSENTLNAALKRMGYGSDRITAHGFRATFSTFANESGLWHVDAVERALAHVEGNEVRRAYVRGEHWSERVEMAKWWADELDAMRRSTQNE